MYAFLLIFKIALFNSIEYIKTLCNYYSNPLFRRWDLSLISSYLFFNPFTISRHFLESKGEHNLYQYGETPLSTLDLIAKKLELSTDDHFVDLGSGRGRCCFWIRAFYDCKTTGVEQIPFFTEKAHHIVQKYQIEHLRFINDDFLTMDLSFASIIFLYGSNLEDERIQALCQHLSILQPGTRFVSISFPLSDFSEAGIFETIDEFDGVFPWGTTTIFIQKRL